MMMADTWRGWRIHKEGSVWVFDNGQLVCDCSYIKCGHCGLDNTPEGHDGCLGTLPGVMNACCGHGKVDEAWVQFEDGKRLVGEEALAWVETVKV